MATIDDITPRQYPQAQAGPQRGIGGQPAPPPTIVERLRTLRNRLLDLAKSQAQHEINLGISRPTPEQAKDAERAQDSVQSLLYECGCLLTVIEESTARITNVLA